ncbi:hypothetical protein F0U83_14370 [Neptunomonas concharum]|uniref:Invertebrate defensins family profile domain-containing protein n=1 Tax=Neptunomonas concharum TaxID=1031538 RepID=A0A5P1RDT8_9GAMM|nr:hypothetical protein F0U83_14370 [Neptunomonas concharum]
MSWSLSGKTDRRERVRACLRHCWPITLLGGYCSQYRSWLASDELRGRRIER